MNNDLISREALKATIIEPLNVNDVCKNDWYEGYYTAKNEDVMTINNAPTVDPFEPDYVGAERLKARQRGYEEGYHNGLEIGKTLNPKIKQGEWIHNSDRPDTLVCSICNCGWDMWRYESKELKYCPNCGSDMRGKEK